MDADPTRSHWDTMWLDRDPTTVSWFDASSDRSLDFVTAAARPHDPVIDVGGGASTLVDRLLDLGYRGVTVVDVSTRSLEASRRRLGDRADLVRWVIRDVRSLRIEGARFAVWHDRAVFHFLVDAEDRTAYVDACRAHLQPDGLVVISTFAPDGPESCSGLPVRRYDAAGLTAEFGPGTELIAARSVDHVTPSGATQRFVQVTLRPAWPDRPVADDSSL